MRRIPILTGSRGEGVLAAGAGSPALREHLKLSVPWREVSRLYPRSPPSSPARVMEQLLRGL